MPGTQRTSVLLINAGGGGRYYCYCGEVPGDKYQEEDCDKVCDGDENSTCGGYADYVSLNSLYGTGQ